MDEMFSLYVIYAQGPRIYKLRELPGGYSEVNIY